MVWVGQSRVVLIYCWVMDSLLSGAGTKDIAVLT